MCVYIYIYIYILYILQNPHAPVFLYHSDTNPYSSFGATLEREDEKNLWSMPHDVSHTEADDDRILYNLIVVRNQQARDSEVSALADRACVREQRVTMSGTNSSVTEKKEG